MPLVHIGVVDGNALRGLIAVMHVKRPGEAGQGTALALSETSTGNFAGRLFLPQRGLWLVSLSLTRGKDRYYQEWEVRVP